MDIICSGTCPVDPADLHHDAWMVSRNVFKITLLFRPFCISNTLLNWNWVNIATVFSQNNPLSTQDVNPLERTCTLYRNHSDGIYRVGHTTLILYHILELARALTSHYFFTVSGKDLNGSLKTLWPWLYPIITIAERLYDPDFIKTTCSNSSSESDIVEIFHADLSHRHPPSHPCVSGRFIVQRSFCWFVSIWSLASLILGSRFRTWLNILKLCQAQSCSSRLQAWHCGLPSLLFFGLSSTWQQLG